jgi:hypothetical protein
MGWLLFRMADGQAIATVDWRIGIELRIHAAFVRTKTLVQLIAQMFACPRLPPA